MLCLKPVSHPRGCVQKSYLFHISSALSPCSAPPSLHLHEHHLRLCQTVLCQTIYPTIKVGVASIQGNESRRKVTESHTSYPPGSFKGRTKGLPPSFPINLYALPHTGSMTTSVAHVTYLIWLWDCFLRGMVTFSRQGGQGGSIWPESLTDKRWMLIFIPSLSDTKWVKG